VREGEFFGDIFKYVVFIISLACFEIKELLKGHSAAVLTKHAG
jgi:hypothetical protein